MSNVPGCQMSGCQMSGCQMSGCQMSGSLFFVNSLVQNVVKWVDHSMLGKNVTQIWGYMAKTIKTIKYTLKIFILAKN